MQENTLHAQLKQLFNGSGAVIEAQIDGYYIDVVQDFLCIEIQTGNFHAIRRKIEDLVQRYPVHLVYPVALERWIVRLPSETGVKLVRRRSPRKGRLEDIFYELTAFPRLVNHPNFSLEIILTKEEEYRVKDGKGSWRKKGWSIKDRKLLDIFDRVIFLSPQDFTRFIPYQIPPHFTIRNLANYSGTNLRLASKMGYCFREMGLIRIIGKQRNAYLYQVE